MAKAIIDTEFICRKNAKQNVIYLAAMIIVNKSGEEVFAKKEMERQIRFKKMWQKNRIVSEYDWQINPNIDP